MSKVILTCKGVGCDNTFATYTTRNKKYCSRKCRYSDPEIAVLLRDNITYKHKLSCIDAENQTALCSVCGAVDIRERKEAKVFSENPTWRCRTAERARIWARQYGLSSAEVMNLLLSQKYLCAICSEDVHKTFHVDHDHVSGKVRGLLCRNCNTGIGLLKDSADVLESASKYLKKHEN